MASTQTFGSASKKASARDGFRTVATFTVAYGLFAAILLAGMATLTPNLRTDVADAGGNFEATVSHISQVIRLASAE